MTAIVHHPARHPFVDNLWPGRGASAADPPGAPAPIWDVDRLVAAGVRLVHLHFGFEQRSAEEVATWARDLADRGIGVVHTAHDLDNPHLVAQAEFHRTVGVLAATAAAVTTLSTWAASEIRRRYGVAAAVIPHPHIVPFDDLTALRRVPGRRGGVYVHVGTGRPNLDLGAIERLVGRPTRPPVLVHARPQADPVVLEALAQLARRGRLLLSVEGRLSDRRLWERLSSAQLVLLPYRWGTHSGLLEAAHDLGTPVLAPSFGGYADQGAHTYDEDPGPKVAEAISSPPVVTVADRRRGRCAARAAFDAIHAGVLRAVS